jgi:hypothetical protein
MWNRCLELLWFPLPAVGISSQCWLHSTLSDGLYEHAGLGSVFLSFILGTVSKMWVLRPDWVVDSPPFHPRLAADPVPRTCSFWDTQGWTSPETWQSWTDFKFCHNFLYPPLMTLELLTVWFSQAPLIFVILRIIPLQYTCFVHIMTSSICV